MIPTGLQTLQHVEAALDELFFRDSHLFHASVNERSVTSKLMSYLVPKFPTYDVDAEYNRMGAREKKQLNLTVPPGLQKLVSVFPDIIVHQRGRGDRNHLVIEVKKINDAPDARHRNALAFDRIKLQAFISQLGYTHGLFIEYPVGPGALRSECQLEFC